MRSLLRFFACALGYGLVGYLALLVVLRPWQRDWGSFEPAHFIMERAMLRGIKPRTENGEARSFAYVERRAVSAGEDVVLRFEQPLSGRALDQIWVALFPADAPATSTAGRIVLEHGTQIVRLHTANAGAYEVRIHDHYPAEDSHLALRIPVTIDGYIVRTGIEPMPPPREAQEGR